jgi:GntR family galactonate operon transcriptional repressor
MKTAQPVDSNLDLFFPSMKRGLKDQIVEEIGSQIVAGLLQPSELLPSESMLLARFNVSRTVLREAITVLSSKGLIEARAKRGTIVKPRLEWNQLDPAIIGWSGVSQGDICTDEVANRIDQLIEVRHIIEPAAAALAARRGTKEDLAFHIACLRAAHNDFLLPIAHAIRTAMTTSLRITNRNPEENHKVSLPLHRAILEAVLARDAEAAVAAMAQHLDDTKRRRDKSGRHMHGSG